jgi:hypothetical protein
MTATNHGLVGMLIGAYLPLPVAIPLAFVSHFVLDIIPHFGIPRNKRNNSKGLKIFMHIDASLAFALGVIAVYTGKWDMFITGLVAYSPDFVWFITYWKNGGKLNVTTNSKFSKFHKDIQKFERPWGAIVELALFAFAAPITLRLLVS